MATHLDERAGIDGRLGSGPFGQDSGSLAVSGGVNADDLLIAADITDWDLEHYRMDVKASLAIEHVVSGAEI